MRPALDTWSIWILLPVDTVKILTLLHMWNDIPWITSRPLIHYFIDSFNNNKKLLIHNWSRLYTKCDIKMIEMQHLLLKSLWYIWGNKYLYPIWQVHKVLASRGWVGGSPDVTWDLYLSGTFLSGPCCIHRMDQVSSCAHSRIAPSCPCEVHYKRYFLFINTKLLKRKELWFTSLNFHCLIHV